MMVSSSEGRNLELGWSLGRSKSAHFLKRLRFRHFPRFASLDSTTSWRAPRWFPTQLQMPSRPALTHFITANRSQVDWREGSSEPARRWCCSSGGNWWCWIWRRRIGWVWWTRRPSQEASPLQASSLLSRSTTRVSSALSLSSHSLPYSDTDQESSAFVRFAAISWLQSF